MNEQPETTPSITLEEVARLAGVSGMTVSRVLHDHANVSDQTRAKVQAAIATLGYVPNRLAGACLLYTSPSPRDGLLSRMPSSA